MSKFYIDCEFDGHSGPLLSIAMVREDGTGIHIQTDVKAADAWVVNNVMPLMHSHKAEQFAFCYPPFVGRNLRDFIGEDEHPVIIADSPVDIGRFCSAISTGEEGGWESTGYPKMTFEVHNVDCYPTDVAGAVQHNAYWDAMALRHRLSHK